MSHLAERKL